MQLHLDDSNIDDYLTRTLPSARLRRLDAHVASCLECAIALETMGLDARRWERRGVLGRLRRVAAPARERLDDAGAVERAA
jgi:hypothetical protein